MKKYLLLIFILLTHFAWAQKKEMTQETYKIWNSITNVEISPNGRYVKYHLRPGYGNSTLKIFDAEKNITSSFERVKSSQISADNEYLIFTVTTDEDSITALKRKKVKKKDFPKDTLMVLNLSTMVLDTIPAIDNYKSPEEWSGIIAYKAKIEVQKDTSGKTSEEDRFFIYHLTDQKIDTLEDVDEYVFAKKGEKLVYSIEGRDSLIEEGVFVYDVKNNEPNPIFLQEGKYSKLTVDEKGTNIAFLVDADTTKIRIRPFDLYLWSNGDESAQQIVSSKEKLTDKDWFVSDKSSLSFSEMGNRLFFGIAPEPILPDSLALEEEMVQVEVWTTEDPMLYTMQEVQENRLKNKTFEVVYDISSKTFLPLETDNHPEAYKSQKGEGPFFLATDSEPYEKELTWTGEMKRDVYVINVENTEELLLGEAIVNRPNISPGGNFAYWFEDEMQQWRFYNFNSKESVLSNIGTALADEENDSPTNPRPYGIAGWSEEDESVFIYDRFDIWKVGLDGEMATQKITEGRAAMDAYRMVSLDRDLDFLPTRNLVRVFNEEDKTSGYGWLDLESGNMELIERGPFNYTRRPVKAKDADKLLFTKESFELFPDLIYTDLGFDNQKVISFANPQQEEYAWGSIELFEWTDFKGKRLKGLLVKPDNFDPLKKYPVIVNFYERSSDGLYNHRAPEPHRSTINYSYYANKGYIIFNPDVHYEIGYPGESCYNAVVSGVEALSRNQFIDKEKIGVQGHSWGGYQIAYLLNKTNIFKCAEAGAPVVNMVSAYGGIRWGSGMSRMFQYERTQSRLGKTLWEDPELYLKNSPIFEIDKMETPVLILHNDEDGAVPWYQGIEYYMALRRLGKTAWLLNYNGEPHWPLKWENRLDFNQRMEQFFGYYLKDEAKPLWMKEGVPAIEKGINQRLD